MIRILIGGDVCPMGRIQSAFTKGNAREIFSDMLEEIESADLSVVNLECPLISQESPIAKAGPVLGSSVKCIKGFVAAKWNVLNLANNHSYDHGANGLRETIHTIEEAGLGTVGVGMNISEAQKPLVGQISGQRIVIYAMAEHEFSIADPITPGANPLDLINLFYAIRSYKQQGLFIVLIHGGKEYYPYPSPEMVRRYRCMVDMGADAIISTHTHCPLPWEVYRDRPIIYGLGNLIFEVHRKQPDSWYQGYLAKLALEDGRISFEAIPYYQSKERPGARKMDQIERQQFLSDMHKKNSQVKDDAFIKDRWENYCRRQRHAYLATLFGYNRVMHKMSSVLLRTLHSKYDRLRALHLVQCETHREILNTIFKDERQTK